MQKITLAKSFKTKGLSKVVVCSLTTGIDTSGILKGSLGTTSTDGNDTFVGTHTTMTALDTLDGGAGTDTLLYIDDSAAGTPLTVQFSNIETVAVRNLSGDAAAVGKAEVATVTVGALRDGQFITVAGQTLLASADLTAAQVASALSGTTVVGATLSGTLSSSFTKAAGTNTDQVVYTGGAVGNLANLEIGGNASVDGKQVSVITVSGATIATTATFTIVVNNVAVPVASVGTANSTSLLAANVATSINGHMGSNVATAVGSDVQLVTPTLINIGALTPSAGDAAVATVLASGDQTIAITVGTAPTAGDKITFLINGETVTTAALTGVDATAAELAIANAINAHYGATIAAIVGGNIVVSGGDIGLAIHGFAAAAGNGVYTAAYSATAPSSGIFTTDATVVSIVDGVAAVAASTNAMTVDASAFEGVTTIMNTASTDAVTFSGMTEIATLAVEKVTAGALATTTANFDADLTNGTADVVNVSLSGNTSAGTITIGAGFETVNVSAAGTNTVAGLVTGAKTVNITGAGNLTITATIADATKIDGSAATGKLTLTSAVAKVDIDTGTGADKVTLGHAASSNHELSVSTGAGNDTVVITNLVATAELVDNNVTIDGGAGTDTLEMKEALAETLSALSAADYAKKGIINFEKLAISNALDGAVDTERLGLTNDVTLKAGSITSAALNNMASGATVTIGDTVASQLLTVGIKGAADAGRTADVLNIVLADEHTANADFGKVTAASVETININSTTGNDALTSFTNTLNVVATSAKVVNISGDMKFTLGTETNTATNFVALESINASGNTAGVVIDLKGSDATNGYSQAVTITGTAKADTITGGKGNDIINAGAGNDTVNSSAGVDVFTLGAGNDTYATADATDSFVGASLAARIVATDRITDWSSANDVIDINVASLGTTFVAQSVVEAAITAAGASSLSGAITAAAAALGTSGVGAFRFDGNTYVFANDATAGTIADTDFMVRLDGLHTLTADNFI